MKSAKVLPRTYTPSPVSREQNRSGQGTEFAIIIKVRRILGVQLESTCAHVHVHPAGHAAPCAISFDLKIARGVYVMLSQLAIGSTLLSAARINLHVLQKFIHSTHFQRGHDQLTKIHQLVIQNNVHAVCNKCTFGPNISKLWQMSSFSRMAT